MPTDQYHEPPEELSEETRTFARICTSLIEEAEAISWYEQRLSLEKDAEAHAIMANAQQEEFKHFCHEPRVPPPALAEVEGSPARRCSSSPGDIVEHGEEAEEAESALDE